jgi:hypothetical protein
LSVSVNKKAPVSELLQLSERSAAPRFITINNVDKLVRESNSLMAER